jgi:outer membrane receptor protein involved in Fe transport
MKMRFLFLLVLVLTALVFLSSLAIAGTTGKIAGTITDKLSGEPIIGANVIVLGTSLGISTDINGEYSILFVPPGVYQVQISYIGYTKITITDVRVYIDQTTRVDVTLEAKDVQVEESVVYGERLIKPDVSAAVVSVNEDEISLLPVVNMASVVQTQAGVQDNLQIRGGDPSDALVLVNGISLRDPRNNSPITSIPMSSVKEISIERSGFNAEYGQVRSGIVNVVTKEGDRSQYNVSLNVRYSPYQYKANGISPYDPNSYWLRPYLDPAVCWTGTNNGAWDEYTKSSYRSWEGWNSISQQINTTVGGTYLSPAALQKQFLFQTRRRPANRPDYDIDVGFGGPIPLIGQYLGDLRFFSAYRRQSEALLVPLTREDNLNWDWNVRFNSDPTNSIKLNATIFSGKQYSQAQNWPFTIAQNWASGLYITSPQQVADQVTGYGQTALFNPAHFSPSEISYTSISVDVTQFLSPTSYYQIRIERMSRSYFSEPTTPREMDSIYQIVDGFFVNEEPFGYSSIKSSGWTDLEFGGSSCLYRDHSSVSATSLKADFTSQLDFRNLLKAGVEINYNDLNFDYGQALALSDGISYANRILMRVYPIRVGVYIQDKLETNGFVANLGLRVDYSDPQADWYTGDPFSESYFVSGNSDVPLTRSKPQWQFSPRLGISHPITENSKLYFNYGHFKQMPSYENMFSIGRSSTGQIANFGNPNQTLAKTVAYELGYDHYLGENVLLQISAFYRDITNSQLDINGNTLTVWYTSLKNNSHVQPVSSGYADVRGLEISLRKMSGRFWTGFANYTYQSTSGGWFGDNVQLQNLTDQTNRNAQTDRSYLQVPVPSPYARINLSLFTPDDFGPQWGSFSPLGGFLLNVFFNWQSGYYTTYNPFARYGINNNVQTTDDFDMELRFSKAIAFSAVNVELFVDVNNALNYKSMNMNSFSGTSDRDSYMESLHLPKSDVYYNVPGDDRVGEYREDGVKYQPVLSVKYLPALTDVIAGTIYYDIPTATYKEVTNGQWVEVDKARMNKILSDKAYINMPNITSFTFLNPRQIFFGIKVSVKI